MGARRLAVEVTGLEHQIDKLRGAPGAAVQRALSVALGFHRN
jgi:hypothetical protein